MGLVEDILKLRTQYSDDEIRSYYQAKGVSPIEVDEAFSGIEPEIGMKSLADQKGWGKAEAVQGSTTDDGAFETPVTILSEVAKLRKGGYDDQTIRDYYVQSKGIQEELITRILDQDQQPVEFGADRETLEASDVGQAFVGGVQQMGGGLLNLAGHGTNILLPGRPGQRAVEAGSEIMQAGQERVSEVTPESAGGALAVGLAETTGEVVDIFLPGGIVYQGGKKLALRAADDLGRTLTKGLDDAISEGIKQGADEMFGELSSQLGTAASRADDVRALKDFSRMADETAAAGQAAAQSELDAVIAKRQVVVDRAVKAMNQVERTNLGKADRTLKNRMSRLRQAFRDEVQKANIAQRQMEQSVSHPPKGGLTELTTGAQADAMFDNLVMETLGEEGPYGAIMDTLVHADMMRTGGGFEALPIPVEVRALTHNVKAPRSSGGHRLAGDTFQDAIRGLLDNYQGTVAAHKRGVDVASKAARQRFPLPTDPAERGAQMRQFMVEEYQAGIQAGRTVRESIDDVYRKIRGSDARNTTPPRNADDMAARGASMVDDSVEAYKAVEEQVTKTTPRKFAPTVPDKAPDPDIIRPQTTWDSFRDFVFRGASHFMGGKLAQIGEGSLRRVLRTIGDKEIRANMANVIPDLYENYKGEVSSAILQLRYHKGKILEAMDQVVSRTGEDVATAGKRMGEQLTEARRSKDYRKIQDPELREAFENAGKWIDDELSPRYISEGMVTEDGAKVIEQGFGEYLRTSYRSFSDPTYSQTVRQETVWGRAFDWLKSKYGDTMTDSEIYGLMSYLVSPEARKAVKVGKDLKIVKGLPDLPRQDLTNLVKKKNMPPVIRELMGQETDFLTNLDKTVVSMVSDLGATKFQRNLLQSMLDNGMVRTVRSGDDLFIHPIKFDKLTDVEYYTTKEFSDFFNATDILGDISKQTALQTLNGLTKFGKVVFSLSAQARNLWSLTPMLVQTGLHTMKNPRRTAKAVGRAVRMWKTQLNAPALKGRVGVRKLAKLPKDEFDDMMAMSQRNMLGQGTRTGDIEMWSKQLQKAGATAKQIKSFQSLWESRPLKAIRGYKDLMKSAYLATDDLGKHLAYQLQKAHFEDMLTTIPEDKLIGYLGEITGTSVNSIADASAEMTKNTMQHFARTAPVGRQASRNPFFGTFVSFQVEMPRNAANTLRYSAREHQLGKKLIEQGKALIQNGSPERGRQLLAHGRMFKRSSKMRFWGLAAGVGGTLAASEASELLNGIDSQQEKSFRELMPMPWMKSSDLIYVGKEGTKYRVLDMGFFNPYSQISDILRTVMSTTKSVDEKLLDAARLVKDVFLGRELFFSSTAEVLANHRIDTGSPVYNPEDPDAFREGLAFWIKNVQPGDAATLDKITQAISDQYGEGTFEQFGIKPSVTKEFERSLVGELINLIGLPRYYEFDSAEMFGTQVNRQAARWSKISQSMRRKTEGKQGSELLYEQNRHNEDWMELQDEVLEYIDHARRTGVSEKRIAEILGESQFGKARAGLLMQGKKTPMSFGQTKKKRVYF